MTTDVRRGRLRAVLECMSVDRHLLMRNFEALSPFFAFARLGHYGRSVHPEPKEITSALSRALSTPVNRLVGIPVENERFGRIFDRHGSTSLFDVMYERHYGALSHHLGERGIEALDDKIHESLFEGIRDTLPEEWRYTVWNSINTALCYYLGYTVCGQAEKAEELASLIAMLPAVVPIRKHKTEQDKWFVLLF